MFLCTHKMYVDDSVEKFRQSLNSFSWKCKLNWKKNRFCEWISSKSSRTFRMQLWQNWRNFFFRTNIFFSLEHEVKWNITKFCQKIEKFFRHVEYSLRDAAETFRQRSGGLSLKVRKQFWKNRKKITFHKVLLWTSKL